MARTSFALLIAVSTLACVSCATIEYEWTSGFSGPENRAINISQGDTLHITWNSPKHNVYRLADKAAFEACTGSGIGADRTGQTLLYPPEEDNGADGAASGSFNIVAP